MKKGQTLHFGKIAIKVRNIDYALDNQLEIRHLDVRKVSIFKLIHLFLLYHIF